VPEGARYDRPSLRSAFTAWKASPGAAASVKGQRYERETRLPVPDRSLMLRLISASAVSR